MADPERPTFTEGDLVAFVGLLRDEFAVVRVVKRMGTVAAQITDVSGRDDGPVRWFERSVSGRYPAGLRHLRDDERARIEWRRAWKAFDLVWCGSDCTLRVNNTVSITTQEQLDRLLAQLAEGWRLLQERPR